MADDREEQLSKAGKSTIRLLEKNMPSFFFGQAILNKKIFEGIHENLNPGYTTKKRLRLEKSGIIELF